jgi:hypothetical protein
MTPRDAFWAAKILMRFTPQDLLAIVQSGQFSNPDHETYFHAVLVERQRKTGAAGLNLLNPLDEFEVAADGLRFANLSERYGFATSGTTYDVSWSAFDNAAGRATEVLRRLTTTVSTIPLPRMDPDADGNRLLLAEIVSRHPDHPAWAQPVRVYLRWGGTRYDVIAIERESERRYLDMS